MRSRGDEEGHGDDNSGYKDGHKGDGYKDGHGDDNNGYLHCLRNDSRILNFTAKICDSGFLLRYLAIYKFRSE